MTKNANLPAMPCVYADMAANGQREIHTPDSGLTKLELFCLHHGVPETGDPDLDSIIRKGNHQKAAMMAMQGILAGGVDFTMYDDSDVAAGAVTHANNLFAKLEKQQ